MNRSETSESRAQRLYEALHHLYEASTWITTEIGFLADAIAEEAQEDAAGASKYTAAARAAAARAGAGAGGGGGGGGVASAASTYNIRPVPTVSAPPPPARFAPVGSEAPAAEQEQTYYAEHKRARTDADTAAPTAASWPLQNCGPRLPPLARGQPGM